MQQIMKEGMSETLFISECTNKPSVENQQLTNKMNSVNLKIRSLMDLIVK